MGDFGKAIAEEAFRKGYQEGYQEEYQIAIKKGIRGVLSAARKSQILEADILEAIKKGFSLTDEEARKYMSELK